MPKPPATTEMTRRTTFNLFSKGPRANQALEMLGDDVAFRQIITTPLRQEQLTIVDVKDHVQG